MYLLISPELSNEDFKIIQKHHKITEDVSIFSTLKLDEEINDNIKALSWLLDCGRLEIKIVVAKKADTSLFHQKFGIFFDEDNNCISFSGSINESAQAWLNNIEEFKVFKSWEEGQRDYIQSDIKKFVSYWKDEKKGIADVYDIPDALRERIISIKPNDIYDLSIMTRYRKEKKNKNNLLSLFKHQETAVEEWKLNNFSLLMEMATGTGKTRTAIGCLVSILHQYSPLLIIITTPQGTLSRQWQKDFNELNIQLDRSEIIDGTNSSWRRTLELLLLDLSDNLCNTAVIFTTHRTSSDDDFISIVQDNKYSTKYMFICDEAHAIGSAKQKKALLDIYDLRVGLSATPSRMFDDTGTELIRRYFGNKSFTFSIKEALKTINPVTGRPFLNKFYYFPIFVQLSEGETKLYNEFSKKIAIEKAKEEPDEKLLERYYEQRSDIIKNADNKIHCFEKLINDLVEERDIILFVSDKQISRVMDILTFKSIKHAKITEEESAKNIVNDFGDTERQDIIRRFQTGELQVLVGIKCLDEGIDIKNARIAILLSNSTNPREYVQRVGRVIRDMPNKLPSVIYDIIVEPNKLMHGADNILEKEGRRANQIAQNAENYDKVKLDFLAKGVKIDANK